MRIAIIGTGAIGGTMAALLDRGGHDLDVTARGTQLEAIRASGLQLQGAWGEHTARPFASGTLTRPPELAFVCTKAQDASEAIRANQRFLAGVPTVIVQNGLTGLDEAVGLLPGSACIGGIAVYAAHFLAPGRVQVTVAANTYLGAGDGEPGPATLEAARILGAVMPAQPVKNFTGCQWTKLIVNQVNAMPAITGLSAQETLGDRALRHIITAGMREAVRVGIAAGIRFGSIQGLNDVALRTMARVPEQLGQLLPWLMGRRMGPVPNAGSTLQSIRRGQKTEIDYLNGEVVRQALKVGSEAPVNALLTRMVHEVEESAVFRDRASVLARFTALG